MPPNTIGCRLRNVSGDSAFSTSVDCAGRNALWTPGAVLGVFSTASFYWIRDHDGLFRNLYGALRPKGWLHAQCGGSPNLDGLRQQVWGLAQTDEFSNWLGKFREPWFFSDAEGAAARLRAAGFENVETGLEEAAFTAPSGQEFGQ
jgi:hypothetical protein